LVIGCIGELSSLSLVLTPAAVLLPLTRFVGLIWLLGVSARLPAARQPESRLTHAAAHAN